MYYKLLLCFVLIPFVLSKRSSKKFPTWYFGRDVHEEGIRTLLGGRPFVDTLHQSVVNGILDKKKMIEVVFETSQELCGGTIIGEKYILTAAHCFVDKQFCRGAEENAVKDAVSPMMKNFFNVYIEGICHNYKNKVCPEADAGRSIAVAVVYILSEYYQKNCTSGDLAIIELTEIIGNRGATLSDSIELPTSGDFQVSGFGIDPENSVNTGHNLQTVTLTAQKCKNAFYDSICTIEIDKNVCQGDSGGALVNEKDVIFGVVSSGMDCVAQRSSVLNAQADDLPLKEWNGGIFTATAMHFGFICEIVGAIKGCPEAFEKEKYLTIS